MTTDGCVGDTSTRARTIGTQLFSAKDDAIALQSMPARCKEAAASQTKQGEQRQRRTLMLQLQRKILAAGVSCSRIRLRKRHKFGGWGSDRRHLKRRQFHAATWTLAVMLGRGGQNKRPHLSVVLGACVLLDASVVLTAGLNAPPDTLPTHGARQHRHADGKAAEVIFFLPRASNLYSKMKTCCG